MGVLSSIVVGFLVGVIIVYCIMLFDNVKM